MLNITETYNSWLSKSPLLWVVLVHHHCIWIGTSWNNHCCIGATTHDSAVVHYILREVLSIL